MKTLVKKILKPLRAQEKDNKGVPPFDKLFTKKLSAQRAFSNDPFFLLDVGASGGISNDWDLFGKDFGGFGFDPLVEECEKLNLLKKRPNFEYIPSFVIAGIPELDQLKRMHYWYPRSSAYRAYDNSVKNGTTQAQERIYSKDQISLDQFCELRSLKKVDFVKIDTDGFDYKVIRGGEKLFSQLTTLGSLVECNFTGEPGPHANCFRNIEGFFSEKGYRVFDLSTYRYTKENLPGKFSYRLNAQTRSGQACWGDVLFLRDFVDMKAEGVNVSPHSLLKMACLMEMFNLPDCAAELLQTFEEELSPFIDHRKALDLLARDMGLFQNYKTHLTTFQLDSNTFYPEEISH